jgi:low affinity Fe/Cu permease
MDQEKERNFFCVVTDAFRIFARRSSIILGSAWAFAGAMLVILIWILTGPTFHFSDTWQLIINTATTIITFLMVFLIQNTQNRDAKAVHLKLDEIIRALKGARNELVDLEELSDEDLKTLEKQFQHPQNGGARQKSCTHRTAGIALRTQLNRRWPRIFSLRRFAEKFCRSDKVGKLRNARSPAYARNSDAVRAR